MLLALQKFEDELDRSYATRREIKDAAKKFNVDIQNWTMIETLEKHNLISKSILGDEVKYALTGGGKKVAELFQ